MPDRTDVLPPPRNGGLTPAQVGGLLREMKTARDEALQQGVAAMAAGQRQSGEALLLSHRALDRAYGRILELAYPQRSP